MTSRSGILRDGDAQLGYAGRGSVVRSATAQRFTASGNNVVGCIEIRLAYLKVHDIAALSLQRLSPREHLKGRLRTQPAHPLRELHCASSCSSLSTAVPLDRRTRAPIASARGRKAGVAQAVSPACVHAAW